MLFRAKAKTESFAPPTDIPPTKAADDIQAHGARGPKTAYTGQIRLGGGCRLPLQGDPMERDRSPRGSQSGTE